jgi:hypothetical protein
MAEFGVGPELAAKCPRVPPPDGWQPWTDANGPIPDALATRAQAIAADTAVPLGTTESYPLPGVTTLIRVEPHSWGRDATGNLVQGCFKAAAIFLPSGTAPAAGTVTPPSDGIGKAVGVLTAVSLAVGTIATIATLKGRKKAA